MLRTERRRSNAPTVIYVLFTKTSMDLQGLVPLCGESPYQGGLLSAYRVRFCISNQWEQTNQPRDWP